jgi:Phosphotransferase enzyme family
LIHRLDPQALGVTALGPVRSAREHALERIADIRRRATRADGSIDPLVRVSADWLERNVPDYDGPVVLVQGDTGPGNFLYADGRVTAVLDWELSHWGDPMDDIAWLSLRTVQDTFTHLPDRLAEYVEASGHPLDVRRVWYYRVFAETTMRTLYPLEREVSRHDGAEPAEADIGNQILYTQLHRRLWLEALDAVMDLSLSRPGPVEPAELPPWHDHYGDALSMLLTTTPRISDPLASQWSKGVARLLRYLRDTDAVGREYLQLERSDIEELLGAQPDSLEAARAALELANRTGSVSDEQFVTYLWNRTMREDLLMRNASGALGRRTWPPLVDDSARGDRATAPAGRGGQVVQVGPGDSR